MAIVKMKKLSLLAVRENKDALLRELICKGCVELSQIEPDEALKRETANVLALKAKLSSAIRAIELLDRYVPEKTPLLSPKPELEDAEFLSDDGMEDALAVARTVEECEEQIRRIAADESRERSTREMLKPWLELDMPLSVSSTDRCAVVPGTLPAKADMENAKTVIAAASEEAELFSVSADKNMQYVLLVCMREALGDVQDALRGVGFSAVSFNGSEGTARECSDRCEAALKALADEKERRAETIRSLAPHRNELKLCADRLAGSISMAEAEEQLCGTESTVVLQGWMPAEREDELKAVFEKYDCAWETLDPTEEEYPDVPVQLKNNKVTNALNMVTNMYSLPQYGTLDPNPLMAPFFILFYGLMMADIGYGIMMILAAVVALKKIKPREGTLSFCQLLLYCGIATLAMGCVTGGLFSDAPLQIAQMIDPNTKFTGLPYLFNPTSSNTFTVFGMTLDSSSMVLYGSMVLGLLHMNTGMVVSFIQKWKAGNKGDAIFEEGASWLLLVGIILAVVKVGNIAGVPVVLILAIAALLFGAGRHSKGFGKVTAAFSCIYNTATGWFGDILSYARIMALMLAGGVIGQVFNTVAAMPAKNSGLNVGTGIAFAVIFLFGHFMNFALNLLGCYVHDLRLQCLEYFNKFYVSGGRAFKPLKLAGRYFNTKE